MVRFCQPTSKSGNRLDADYVHAFIAGSKCPEFDGWVFKEGYANDGWFYDNLASKVVGMSLVNASYEVYKLCRDDLMCNAFESLYRLRSTEAFPSSYLSAPPVSKWPNLPPRYANGEYGECAGVYMRAGAGSDCIQFPGAYTVLPRPDTHILIYVSNVFWDVQSLEPAGCVHHWS